MTAASARQFVSEALTPDAGTADVGAMARGEPGLPTGFTWRGSEYRVAGLIEKWKDHGPCKSSSQSREMYLRRHWYKILTDPPMKMTIYCDRQAKDRKRPKSRWFVHTIEQVEPDRARPPS